jgi:hypothetical protein
MSHHAPTVPMRMLVWDLQEMGLSPSNVLNEKKIELLQSIDNAAEK